jgi:hypothetical protein
MSEDEIRTRLTAEGYADLLAAQPDAPARIKAAASKGMLAVWTPFHLAAFDQPYIDARPKRTLFDAPDAPGDPALYPGP